MMKKDYHKRISLDRLKLCNVARLEENIKKLGYDNSNFRFSHYDVSIELIVTNQELHRDLKIIRRDSQSLNTEQADRLEAMIIKLGYDENDYMFEELTPEEGSTYLALKISNRELHKDFKTIRRTEYVKSVK